MCNVTQRAEKSVSLKHFAVFLIVVQVWLSPFPPTIPPHLQPSSPPIPDPTLLGFVHVSFINVPENTSSFSPHSPLPLPSGYCQIVLNVNVSGYILLACLVD